MGDAKRGVCLSRTERANEDAVRNGLERAGSRSLSVGFRGFEGPNAWAFRLSVFVL